MNLLKKYYDKKYEKERNDFIPIAEKHANDHNGSTSKGKTDTERDEWNIKWNRDFHSKMNELSLCLLNGNWGKRK